MKVVLLEQQMAIYWDLEMETEMAFEMEVKMVLEMAPQ